MLPFQANNAFYYYRDVTAAADFYQKILGFRLVADYGFAKILQIAQTSFLTLVDGTKGMHSADEPKTVTLAMVTQEVEGWYDYLTTQNLKVHRPLTAATAAAHDGFVVLDPEGYYLEFERFNPHPENDLLLPWLAEIVPLRPGPDQKSARPANLSVTATVLWLYYQEMETIQRFYEECFGLTLLVDQEIAKVYATSPSGLIGLVVAGEGLHPYTPEKAVTVSLWTQDLPGWFARLQAEPDFRLRTEEIRTANPRFHAFVGYDPEGYFIELNTFLEHEDNEILLAQLP